MSPARRDVLERAGGTAYISSNPIRKHRQRFAASAAAEAERSGGICYIRATSRGPQRYVNGRWVSFSAAVSDDEAPPASERTADEELDAGAHRVGHASGRRRGAR